jgi:hypothetical protein
MKQADTPLAKLFYSGFNTGMLQRGIRQTFKDKTGIAIDYQNPDDLYSIMRTVFIGNAGDQYSRVNEQVKMMNARVIDVAMKQIQTGVSQYIAYTRDIETISLPLDQPINTSTTGKKFGYNTQIGFS